MAVLPEGPRQAAYVAFVDAICSAREEFGIISKDEIRAALDAIDDWVSTNQASFNSALPLPARTVLTTQQKARLLSFVVDKRFLEDV